MSVALPDLPSTRPYRELAHGNGYSRVRDFSVEIIRGNTGRVGLFVYHPTRIAGDGGFNIALCYVLEAYFTQFLFFVLLS